MFEGETHSLSTHTNKNSLILSVSHAHLLVLSLVNTTTDDPDD